MPFSPLRIWGTGLLSWAVLAGGIFCLWKWADSRASATDVRDVRGHELELPAPESADLINEQLPPEDWRANSGRYYGPRPTPALGMDESGIASSNSAAIFPRGAGTVIV